MYVQKFGSLAIGHQTGGLAETIMDGETGFLFTQPSTESFLGGIRRAFSTFMAPPAGCDRGQHRLQRRPRSANFCRQRFHPDGGEAADPDEIVHFSCDKQNPQETPLIIGHDQNQARKGPVSLHCEEKIGSSRERRWLGSPSRELLSRNSGGT